MTQYDPQRIKEIKDAWDKWKTEKDGPPLDIRRAFSDIPYLLEVVEEQ